MPRLAAIWQDHVTLRDGRTVRVSEYSDGSVRVKVSGMEGLRYAMTECFLPGAGHEAIIKLVWLGEVIPESD